MPNISLLPESVLDLIILYPFNAVHPAPPTGPVATYTTDPANRNTNLISLTWTAPVLSPDVVTFNIYRNSTKITSVPNAAPLVYLDSGTGGNVSFFTYFVTSVDAEGNESVPSTTICNFSQRANQYIDELRRTLKDTPADPRVQRWTDDDLWLALQQGISRINAIPMNTSYDFDTMPPDMFNYIIVASRIAALRSQAVLEAAKEFSMGVGGATININRSGVYNNLVQSEDAAFAAEIKSIKLNFTMRTVHGEGILSSPMPFRIRTFAPRQYRVR